MASSGEKIPGSESKDKRTGDKRAAAQSAVAILHEISTILNCEIDRRTLSICISMIENGANPEAVALGQRSQNVIKELRRVGAEIDRDHPDWRYVKH